jgi:hypothetical protein
MNSKKVLVNSGKATALVQDEFYNYLLDRNFMVSHFEKKIVAIFAYRDKCKNECKYFGNYQQL